MASTIGRLTAEDGVPATDGTHRGRLAGRQVVMSIQPLTRDPRERARLLVSLPLGELAAQARAIARGDFTRPRRPSAPAARWASWPGPSSACGSSWARS